MTHEDAATLLCAILASENVKDSVETITSLRKLEPNFQGRRGTHRWPFYPDIGREHDVVTALARTLRLFDREDELHRYHELRDDLLYALFEVQYPQHYAFITIGVRGKFKETWTYGRRGEPRREQIRRVREGALREIAQSLRSEVSALEDQEVMNLGQT